MAFEDSGGRGPYGDISISFDDRETALTGSIGAQLRAMYDGLLREPLPDRLTALMGRLREGGDEPPSEGDWPYGTKD